MQGLSHTKHTEKECVDMQPTKQQMKWLWLAMSALYPQKWNAAMGDVVDSNGDLGIQARVWQRGLSGMTNQHLANAIDYLTDNYSPFIPDLGQFKTFCFYRKDVPSLFKLVDILLYAARSDEEIAKRYQHPIAYAIAKSRAFNMADFRISNRKQCEEMIRPIYEQLFKDGWEEFKPEHYVKQKQLSAPVIDKSIGKKHIAEMLKVIREA